MLTWDETKADYVKGLDHLLGVTEGDNNLNCLINPLK
jgi:hypothetical protein